jgi:cell division inhibitor SepF
MGVKHFFKNLFDDETQEPETENNNTEEEKEENMDNNVKQDTQNTTVFERKSGDVNLELKVVRPESYSSVGQIADHLLNKCTVVLNLEATEKDTARRIVDFLNGVAYSIGGQIKPVANNTFIITPENVSISGEQLTESKTTTTENDEF